MQAFNRSQNFIVQGCSFINHTGGKESLDAVLEKLKNEAASGVSYDSIDRSPDSELATLDGVFLSSINPSPSSRNHSDVVFFVQSINPSDVRAYGESAAKRSKENEILIASVFLRRLLKVFPAETKRRLVPTLAYQLAVSRYAPEELKIEILGALFMDPDLPDKNLTIQFEKLIFTPLRNVQELLPKDRPVVFVLDSLQNTDCDTVAIVIRELVQVVSSLNHEGVTARVVMTGVCYDRIVSAFQQTGTPTRLYYHCPNPSSFTSRLRTFSFPFLNWKYGLPEFWQRVVEVGCVIGGLTAVPFVLTAFSLVTMALLPGPLNVIIGVFGPLLVGGALCMAASVGFTVLIYKEIARLVWPRAI